MVVAPHAYIRRSFLNAKGAEFKGSSEVASSATVTVWLSPIFEGSSEVASSAIVKVWLSPIFIHSLRVPREFGGIGLSSHLHQQ